MQMNLSIVALYHLRSAHEGGKSQSNKILREKIPGRYSFLWHRVVL